MFSEYNIDTMAYMLKSNPDLDTAINAIISENKKTTSMFVHELRNPLSLLKGTIQYIELKHPEAKEFKYWGQMQDLINDMDHIMADAMLLNTCNYIRKESTDLIALVHHVVGSFMPQSFNQQVELTLIIDPACEEHFNSYPCDSIKFKQALSNLIKNAFEATVSGDYIHVILSYMPEEGPVLSKLSLQINNNGQPIPEDVIENIFVPFVTYKNGGTGVGLALVKKVIDMHYGSISVDSTKDLTSFTIQLPL